jgi:hypothetical protein
MRTIVNDLPVSQWSFQRCTGSGSGTKTLPFPRGNLIIAVDWNSGYSTTSRLLPPFVFFLTFLCTTNSIQLGCFLYSNTYAGQLFANVGLMDLWFEL